MENKESEKIPKTHEIEMAPAKKKNFLISNKHKITIMNY